MDMDSAGEYIIPSNPSCEDLRNNRVVMIHQFSC